MLADDILDVADVRALAGGISRTTLGAWRKREPHPFPQPIRVTGGGVELWDRQVVERWIYNHRPKPRGPGR